MIWIVKPQAGKLCEGLPDSINNSFIRRWEPLYHQTKRYSCWCCCQSGRIGLSSLYHQYLLLLKSNLQLDSGVVETLTKRMAVLWDEKWKRWSLWWCRIIIQNVSHYKRRLLDMFPESAAFVVVIIPQRCVFPGYSHDHHHDNDLHPLWRFATS